jgi:VIT1/CCC1 family predicted Fe2+/Mn2+ transporter
MSRKDSRVVDAVRRSAWNQVPIAADDQWTRGGRRPSGLDAQGRLEHPSAPHTVVGRERQRPLPPDGPGYRPPAIAAPPAFEPRIDAGRPGYAPGPRQDYPGYDPRLDRPDPPFDRGDPRFDRGDPRFDRGDPRFDRGDPRLDRGDPRFDRGDPRLDGGRPGYPVDPSQSGYTRRPDVDYRDDYRDPRLDGGRPGYDPRGDERGGYGYSYEQGSSYPGNGPRMLAGPPGYDPYDPYDSGPPTGYPAPPGRGVALAPGRPGRPPADHFPGTRPPGSGRHRAGGGRIAYPAYSGMPDEADGSEEVGHTHRDINGGALRAAVFGAMDGLVTNIALVAGVGGAGASAKLIILSGMAGLVAGAFSMALGEYASVQTQNDAVQAEVTVERTEILTNSEAEEAELAANYRKTGFSDETARRAAREVHADLDQAVKVHVTQELGLDPDDQPSPVVAAVSSFMCFAGGALLPLLPYLLGLNTLVIALIAGGIGLFSAGAVSAQFTTRSWVIGGARQLMFGAIAAGATYLVGSLIGVAVA